MIVVSTVSDLRREIQNVRRASKRVGFVPTMGNLHAGHLKLIDVVRERADFTVASIYVNPLQFGPQEDFASYPRTPEEDRQALTEAGADLLFMPTTEEMYPRGMHAQTVVEVPELSNILCGAFRPGHFRGVTTVVNHLFNLTHPDVAVFGKKDYQQLLLIRLMVSDLGMPIDIVGVDTLRERDGLALSSRNRYLRPDERELAPALHAVLREAQGKLMRGGAVFPAIEASAAEQLRKAGFRPDYVSIVRQQDLGKPSAEDRRLAVLAAAWLGRTRLIDNVEVEIP